MTLINPAHPGDIVREYVEGHGHTLQYAAEKMNKTADQLSSLINGTDILDAHWACVLGKAFGTTAEYWLNLHHQYQVWLAQSKYVNEVSQVQSLVT